MITITAVFVYTVTLEIESAPLVDVKCPASRFFTCILLVLSCCV